ncbi:hypothetical protein HKD24_02805, partial [Gluconobacter sp. LMG 31484]
MSETTTTGASGGQSLTTLSVASEIQPTDKVTGVFSGAVQNGTVADLVAAGLPESVVQTKDLDDALSGAALGQYTAQAQASAQQSQTSANQSQASQAAAAVHSQAAAQSASDAATILTGVKQTQTEVEATSASAQNAVAGVAADAGAAKVLLTAALSGTVPLTYRGYWNASTNTPQLANGQGAEGDLWVVSVAGMTSLDGHAVWAVGDAAWFHNGAWQYYARAGWAAVAQTITSLGEVRAGTARLLPGQAGHAFMLTDSYGFLVAQIGADGSYASDQSSQPAFGLTDAGIFANGLQLLQSQDATVKLLDKAGFPLRLDPLSAPADASPAPVTKRQPGCLDDAAELYATGDVWQSGGEAHTCLYPNANSAIWKADLGVA